MQYSPSPFNEETRTALALTSSAACEKCSGRQRVPRLKT
jgi:hypothetical protein